MTNTREIHRFAAEVVPASAPALGAQRDVVVELIRRWESRTREQNDGDRQRFLPTSDEALTFINDPGALEDFRSSHRMRDDWHEPDEQGINAYVMGYHLDNAMGPSVDHSFGELVIVLAEERDTEDGITTFEPVASVNLATLLSWATDGYRSHQALIEGGIL